MILTLLTFGDRLENHYQASFAILTFLKSDLISRVCVVTDRPRYYSYFDERIDIIEINDDIMNDWRGEHDFFWRIKMKGIEAAAKKNPGKDLLYVDSDTFYVKDLNVIKQGLDENLSFMHEKEGKLAGSTSNTFNKMWRSIAGRTFAGVKIDENSEMWNAGVIALSGNHAQDIIEHAISICDEICQTDCTRRLVEQFAFSLALAHSTKLTAAEMQIGHYWGNKEAWNAKIIEFFMYSKLSNSGMKEDLLRLQEVDLENLPTVYKEKSIKGKVNRLLHKLFPPKEVQYFKGKAI